MRTESRLSLWALLIRRARRAARPQEPADLGTAFGLEQWLDEHDSALGDLPALPADALPAGTLARRRPWLPRWLSGAAAR
jgi:hypothetical protein